MRETKRRVADNDHWPSGTQLGLEPSPVELRTVDLSKFDNSWYRPGGLLWRITWYWCNVLFLKTYFPFPSAWKRLLLVAFGAKVGRNVTIKPDVNIKFPWLLEIGDNVWIGEGVWIDNLARVRIGDNVCLSQGAYLLTGNHDYKKEAFDLMIAPITIENGAWVGAKATICPGVTLRTHSVAGVGSAVNKDTDPYTIYSGNPALAIRKREIS